MSESPIDPKSFWEGKILDWEASRYSAEPNAAELLNKISWRSGASVRARMQIASEILAANVTGKSVVEVGCGSAALAPALLEAGALTYTGIDIAEAAINQAHVRAKKAGIDDRTEFVVGGMAAIDGVESDVVVSLGLLDWLSAAELADLFTRTNGKEFLHSISERRRTVAQFAHRAYVHLAYGHRTGAYVPKYHTVDEIAAIAGRSPGSDLNVVRARAMSFGTLLTTFQVTRRPDE